MKFIVFEGLDGSGKSSLMSAIEAELAKRSVKTYRTREPGGTPLGEDIRNLILQKKAGHAPTARTELLLYEASRSQHVEEVIMPKLKEGCWVLCDRFTASSIAFQAGGRELSLENVEMLNAFATKNLKIDLTVLLDLSVEESRRRRQKRGVQTGETEDRIESENDSFHQRVREGFLSQARREPEAWLVLDASKTPEELLKITWEYLQKNAWV